MDTRDRLSFTVFKMLMPALSHLYIQTEETSMVYRFCLFSVNGVSFCPVYKKTKLQRNSLADLQ